MKRYRLALVVVLALPLAAIGQSSEDTHPAPTDSAPDAVAAAATVAAPTPDLTPDANGKLSQEQMQALFRVVADKDLANDKRQHDYTYIEHDVDNHLDGKGQTKSTEKKSFEILEIYGEQVRRLTEKDGQPLDAKEAAEGRRENPEDH